MLVVNGCNISQGNRGTVCLSRYAIQIQKRRIHYPCGTCSLYCLKFARDFLACTIIFLAHLYVPEGRARENDKLPEIRCDRNNLRNNPYIGGEYMNDRVGNAGIHGPRITLKLVA